MAPVLEQPPSSPDLKPVQLGAEIRTLARKGRQIVRPDHGIDAVDLQQAGALNGAQQLSPVIRRRAAAEALGRQRNPARGRRRQGLAQAGCSGR
jgi:hypothetical protein